MATINELQWSSLTAAVNEMRSPAMFVKRLLYGRHESKTTETIEISVLNKARELAPFVKKNGSAIMVSGHSETFQTVEAPNIRIKRPFRPSELLFNRRPGGVIFSPGADAQVSALQQHIARDLQVLADLVTNSEEYLCCQSLTGQISYQVAPNANFQITFPRLAAHNIVLTTFWDDANPALPNPDNDFIVAKRLINDAVSLGVTDAIMGLEAANAFRRVMQVPDRRLNKLSLTDGDVTFSEQFSEDGVIYMGRFSGVDCWEYSRTVAMEGSTTAIPLIRSKYVEFVSRSPTAEWTLYYGAIADMKALEGRAFVGERFSKSWEIEDPSQMIALLASRPLPVPRRPNASVSMKVVSG